MTTALPAAPIQQGNPSRVVFSSDLVTVGRFWCSPKHVEFKTVGTIDRHTFVFPETAVWIEHEGAPRFLGNPARVTLYNPGQAYTRLPYDADGDRCTWFDVAESLTRDVVAARDRAAADSDRVLVHAFGPAAPAACLKARRLVKLIASGRVDDGLFVEETVIGLFSRVISDVYDHHAGTNALSSTQHDVVETVASHLYRTCTANHSLSTLAASVNVSVFHLCRLFRRATGMTMHAYRHQLRMARALDALGTPDVDLLSLAVDLGYCSHSHFTRVFRRQLGMVPSSVRKQLQM